MSGLSPLRDNESVDEIKKEEKLLGTKVAEFLTPTSAGEAALSVAPGLGILGKTSWGKKLLSKVPGLGKILQGTKTTKTSKSFDFTGSKDFGGGKIPKSLMAPKEQKLLGTRYGMQTHMTSGQPVVTGGVKEKRTLENTLEQMFRPVKTTTIDDLGREKYDDLMWFGPSNKSGRYTYADMETGIGGKVKSEVGWTKEQAELRGKAQDYIDDWVKNNPGKKWYRSEHPKLMEIEKKIEDLQQYDVQSHHKIDVTFDPNAKIKTYTSEVSRKGHALEQGTPKVWTKADIDALKTLYDYTEQEDGSVTRPLGEFPILED
jgi:hypothetical protein